MVNKETSLQFKDILETIKKVQKISADNDELRSAGEYCMFVFFVHALVKQDRSINIEVFMS